MPIHNLTFYMLAEADGALAEPTGFHRDFRRHLVAGPILSSEIAAAIADDRKAIGAHDPSGFAGRVRRHASMARMIASGEAHGGAEELANPRRGTIPPASLAPGGPRELLDPAEDYLLSFAAGAALAQAFEAVDSVVAQGLADPEVAALHPLLRRMCGRAAPIASDRDGAASAIWAMRGNMPGGPPQFCWAAVWLLVHVDGSRLRDGVAPSLVAWTFAGADHLVRNERFRLSTPALTVPPVEAILASPERSLASVARLLLALAPAAATTYASEVRGRLEEIARKG